MVPTSSPERPRRRVLRIGTGCSSVDHFVQVFGPLCDGASLFVPTNAAVEPGSERAFAFTLAGGEPILRGIGRVLARHGDGGGPYGRAGLLLGFGDLTEAGWALVARLGRERAPEPAPAATSDPSVVPANPLGALTDDALEVFVDCTLVEGTGELELPEATVPGGPPPERSGEPGWPEAQDLTPTPRPFPGLGVEPPPGSGPVAAPPPGSGLVVTPPPPPAPRRLRARVVVPAVGVAGVLAGLAAGFLLWAGGGEPEPAGEPRAAAHSEPEPGGEPAGAARSEPEPAGEPSAAAGPGPAGERAPEEAAAGPAAEAAPELDLSADLAPERTAARPPEHAAPEPPIPEERCRVALTSRPDDARVFHEGVLLGRGPVNAALPCGEVTLELRHPRYRTATRTLETVPGEETAVHVGMERPTFGLRVISLPRGADVWIGGERRGTTPLEATVTGFQKVTVEVGKDGYARRRERFYVKRDSVLRVRLQRAR